MISFMNSLVNVLKADKFNRKYKNAVVSSEIKDFYKFMYMLFSCGLEDAESLMRITHKGKVEKLSDISIVSNDRIEEALKLHEEFRSVILLHDISSFNRYTENVLKEYHRESQNLYSNHRISLGDLSLAFHKQLVNYSRELVGFVKNDFHAEFVSPQIIAYGIKNDSNIANNEFVDAISHDRTLDEFLDSYYQEDLNVQYARKILSFDASKNKEKSSKIKMRDIDYLCYI